MKTKPKNKKAMVVSWLTTLCLLFSLSATAQVTIGSGDPPQDFSILEIISNDKGGLRLPQMTTDKRDNVLMVSQAWNDEIIGKGRGLTIYNISNDCVEYWNKTKWISLCTGNTTFEKSCTDSPVDAAGGSIICTITDPNCNTQGAYTFTIVSGSNFASILVTDAGAGSFKLTFDANDQATERQAIVMVTSPCGTSELFIFTQLGDNAGCGSTTVTDIKSVGNTSMCLGGAVYLYLNGYPTGTFIWTLNGQIVGTGNNYTATTPGKYIVYGDKIGCPGSKEILISLDGTGAPAPVKILVTGNNGLVCSALDKIKLISSQPGTGNVRWFKDGVLQSAQTPDNEILAGVGEWFAVVNDGTCWSTPSNTVTVSVDPNGGAALTKPDVEKSSAFCAGGSVQLRVSDATYNASYTYTWYENNTILGTGRQYLYNVPTGVASVVIRCRATLPGSCAAEAISSETITTGTVPQRPSISGDKQLCSGIATLNAVPVGIGSFSYKWYKNGELYSTQPSITINSGGEYSLTVTDGCTSPAARITISDVSSAIPTVTLNKSTENPNQGDIVTYTASINFTPAMEYTWEFSNATLQSGGTRNAYAVVKFENTGSASVTAKVRNACGTGSASHNLTIGTNCSNPNSVTPTSLTSLSAVVNQNVSLGPVSATFDSGSPQVAYQWYRNTTATNTGGTSISGANGNSYVVSHPTAGIYYYYCEVSNKGCSSTTMASGLYTVTVSRDPASITLGNGTFTGKTCFDVAETNDGGGCGTLSYRKPIKSDFEKSATNTQIYTFKPSGSVSKIRFYAYDPTGSVIESIAPGDNSWETATNLSGTYTVEVKYKNDLNTKAQGLDRDNALTATLYVVYNDLPNGSGADKQKHLNISIRDCSCCGAYMNDGEWKEFMCHNKDADETLDPFTPSFFLNGSYYQWGRNTNPIAANTPQSITGYWNTSYASNDAWEDSSKTSNDPCPDGYRVPTKAQWDGVNNTDLNPQSTTQPATWTPNFGPEGYTNGRFYGSSLYLPASGLRLSENGKLAEKNRTGYYWSSTHFETDKAYALGFTDNGSNVFMGQVRTNAYPIRCIKE